MADRGAAAAADADGGAGVLQDVHRAGEPSAGASAGPGDRLIKSSVFFIELT